MIKKGSVEISEITDELFISSEPGTVHMEAILERNIGLIISMIGNHRPPQSFGHPPLELLWLQTFDTILTPIPMRKLFLGVEKALSVIQNGNGVLCYCAQGRHRSVAMGACILIARGYSAVKAMERLRLQRRIARPQTWHIRKRIELFDVLWREQKEQPNRNYPPREAYSDFVTDTVSGLVWRMGFGRER
jgi:hypothetical protein